MANAVRWAANEEQPLKVEGPGVLDVALWKQQSSITAHLVNLTNPMMMKGPLREVIPLPAQEVKIRLPTKMKPRKVQLLVAGGSPRVRESNGSVTLTLPSIGIHEVIAIDLT